MKELDLDLEEDNIVAYAILKDGLLTIGIDDGFESQTCLVSKKGIKELLQFLCADTN